MSFETKLKSTIGTTLSEVKSENADIYLPFSNGAKISSTYWRFIKDGLSNLSSFDHDQQYGRPEPIDAGKALSDQIASLRVERIE